MPDEYRPLPALVETAYVGQKLVFTRSVYWFRTNGERAAKIPGTSYFCPECNEIWARRIVQCTEPAHSEVGDCLLPKAVERRCERHGDGSIVFSELEWNQILDPSDYGEAHYPLSFLAYELFLIVRRFP